MPKGYLVLFVAAPVVMYALALTGALTVLAGVGLLVLFVAFVGLGRLPRVLRAAPGVAQRRALRAAREGRRRAAAERHGDAGPRGGGAGGTGRPDRRGGTGTGGGHRGFDLPDDLRVDQGFLKARQLSPAGASPWPCSR